MVHPTVQGAEKYMYSRAMAQRMNKSERGGKEATLHQAKGDGGEEKREVKYVFARVGEGSTQYQHCPEAGSDQKRHAVTWN